MHTHIHTHKPSLCCAPHHPHTTTHTTSRTNDHPYTLTRTPSLHHVLTTYPTHVSGVLFTVGLTYSSQLFTHLFHPLIIFDTQTHTQTHTRARTHTDIHTHARTHRYSHRHTHAHAHTPPSPCLRQWRATGCSQPGDRSLITQILPQTTCCEFIGRGKMC